MDFQPAAFSDSQTAQSEDSRGLTPSINDTPVDETPVQETPVDETPVEETPRKRQKTASGHIDTASDVDTPTSSLLSMGISMTPKSSGTVSPRSSVTSSGASTPLSSDFEGKLYRGQNIYNQPGLDDVGYENDDAFDEASPADVRSSFSNHKRSLYYCNGNVYKTIYGALKRAASAYPEHEVYQCKLVPFAPHLDQKTRLPRVAQAMSDFFGGRSANEIFESMRLHVKVQSTRNPFNSPSKCIWAEIDDFFNTAIMTTSTNMCALLEHKTVLVTSGYDMANACWAAQSRCEGHIQTMSDNPRLFWATFEKILHERFTAYTPEGGMVDKMIAYKDWARNLWFILAQSTDASRAARKLRHIREKERREQMREGDTPSTPSEGVSPSTPSARVEEQSPSARVEGQSPSARVEGRSPSMDEDMPDLSI